MEFLVLIFLISRWAVGRWSLGRWSAVGGRLFGDFEPRTPMITIYQILVEWMRQHLQRLAPQKTIDYVIKTKSRTR